MLIIYYLMKEVCLSNAIIVSSTRSTFLTDCETNYHKKVNTYRVFRDSIDKLTRYYGSHYNKKMLLTYK